MSKRRRVLAGRHWLHAGKRKETVIGYLCSRGHYVFTADDPLEDACQSKNVGSVVVRQLLSPGGWPEGQMDEFVAEAERSLGVKIETWRKCDCDGLRERLDAVTVTLRQAEAKIVELVAYGEKRYQQWEDLKVVAERRKRMRSEALDRAKVDRKRAEAAEARLIEVLRELARDAKIRGDVGKESGVEAWDYLNLHADKLEREREKSTPNTQEQNIAFRKQWDERYEASQKRKEEKPSCPRCYEDVEHEDDHLVGDKDVNCWFECPADKDRPVA